MVHAVYRTVQESLTNARKHAPGATVSIRLDRDPTLLRLRVHNGPPDPTTRPPLRLPSSGHGLTGLRERATMLRGTLTTGPAAGGGFQVSLTLPWASGVSASGSQPSAPERSPGR
ncbi:ATP-binding protein [Kitasatospora sp. NPDC059973]|uniref:ATP-binding protein n=1 Tax=Kitasatospora sp. NPDC059973 TaxID=3347020 RepID=UPI0036B83DC2